LIKTTPINAPTTDIVKTKTDAGIAIAYILGGKRFNITGSSTNGCN
jgi:hypothetical protein